ncbi:RDD family protein [Chryseobacterium soli]|nr:RDD family protein [Chryseobacterium soli]
MRFANLLIDRAMIYLLFFLYGVFSVLIYELLNIEFFVNITDKLSSMNRIQDILLTSAVYFIYLFSMEYFTKGRTVGKYITGTKVLSTDGTQPTLQDYFIRTISRFVPFDPFSFFGYNGWHDNWSNTRVISIKKYEADRQAKSDINAIGTKEIA